MVLALWDQVVEAKDFLGSLCMPLLLRQLDDWQKHTVLIFEAPVGAVTRHLFVS